MVQTFDEYQEWARRTRVGMGLNDQEYLFHAVFGLASEAGEVAGILQKSYQGHVLDKKHMALELGDCLWMIAEACDMLEISMADVAQFNVDKLRARYPDRFDTEHSLHRKEGDV